MRRRRLSRARGLTAAFLLAGVGACAPIVIPAGPASETPRLAEDHLHVRDGARLPLTAWRPAGGARASVIALHSFGDFRLAFDELGPWLAARGIATYAFDQRGFGEGPHPSLWAGTEAMVDDLLDAVVAVRTEQTARTPLYLLGESMGGAVIVAAAARRPAPAVDGLILAAPAVREAMPLRELSEGMVALAARTVPGNRATINVNRDPRLALRAAERLSGDPRVIREVRIDTYAGLIGLSSHASDVAGDVTLPALVLLGSGDRAVPLVSACAAYARFAGPKVGLYFRGAPHRLLQARDREAAFADVLAWIDRVPPPSLGQGLAQPFATVCAVPAPG